MELIDQLVQGLGVSEDQAKGGAGLLFKTAKEKLGDTDFSSIAKAVPGMDDMLAAAPSTNGDGGGGLMGSISSLAGGALGNLGGLASLAGGFSKLGLDGDMVGKFLPIVMDFVKSKGGDTVTGLLQKALK